MRGIRSIVGAIALGALLTAPAMAQDKGTVGVSMPTKSSARWIDDGNNMVKALTAKGYKVDLQYADNDIPNQLAQIENMITKKEKVLVIAAIDGTTMSGALQQAADSGIKVISYDRLFGGSADDNNAFFFYNGAMSVLQPYIDSGKLVVQSKQVGMDKVSTLRWEASVAQARMDNLLSAFYTQKKVDAVLSPYDGLSIGIIASLKGVGYGSKDLPMPVISGQDAEVPSVKSIIAGEQTSTIFKDTRELAKVAAGM